MPDSKKDIHKIFKEAGQIRANIRYHNYKPTENDKKLLKDAAKIQASLRKKKPVRPSGFYAKIGKIGAKKAWKNPKLKDRKTEYYVNIGKKGAKRRWHKNK